MTTLMVSAISCAGLLQYVDPHAKRTHSTVGSVTEIQTPLVTI
jgi:hypothetical protein